MPDKQPPANQLDIAFSVAAQGIYVFPVRTDGTKRPIKGILWGADATTDPEQIATWWSENPGALVGIHCGKSGLHAVDIDEKGCDQQGPEIPEGRRHPADCTGSGSAELERASFDLPKTWQNDTPSGGCHLIYAAPDGVPLTIAQNYPVRHVDIRAGEGFIVYYGGALAKRPKLAPAPESTLKRRAPVETASSRTSGTKADIVEWLERTTPGKPDKAVRAALKRVTEDGMGHGDMLESVTELTKLGTSGHRGAGAGMAEAREVYTRKYPEATQAWDNALLGSIKRHGMPPVSIPITKTEKKALKRRIAEPRPKPEAGAGSRILEDGPLAVEIGDSLRHRWAWTKETGLLRYRTNVWEQSEQQVLLETIRQCLEKIEVVEHRLAVERGDKPGIARAYTLLARSRVRAVTDLVLGILMSESRTADAYPDLLNVQNGVVDLRTKKLLPHDPDLLFTKICVVDYDPEATSADWTKALEALPPDTVEWLKIRFGQAITGHIPEDAEVPFLMGGGDNGKSAVLNAVRAPLGGYAVTVPDKLLLANPGDHPTELTTLMGARLAITEELPEGRQLNSKRLKDIAGTPKITARRMRQDFVEWQATHSLFVSTNHHPVVVETDHGTWRRLVLVRFPYRFREPGKKLKTKFDRLGDPGLRDRLGNTPSPAVLAWLVEGAAAWYANGKVIPSKPKTIYRDTRKWRHDADPVMQFADEHLVVDEGRAIWVMDMLKEFNDWQESQGQQKWSARTVASRFAGHESLPGVEKKLVKFGLRTKESRPAFTTRPLAPVVEAWRGVRFKASEEAPSSGNVTPFTPRGGKPPHDQHDLG